MYKRQPVLFRGLHLDLHGPGYDTGHGIGGTGMSRKAEASAMMGMAERAEGAAGRKKKAGPVVYCGPTRCV